MSMWRLLPRREYTIVTKPVAGAVTYPPRRRRMHADSPPMHQVNRKPYSKPDVHNLFHLLGASLNVTVTNLGPKTSIVVGLGDAGLTADWGWVFLRYDTVG